MSRLTVVAITSKSKEDPSFQEMEAMCRDLGFAFNVISGAYQDVLEEVAEWNILPEVLILECPDNMDAGEALQALGDVAPEGESETIITNVSNDIKVYRELKAMGIVEVFPGDPSSEALRPTLEAIATKELRSIGIDPRRVVYTWSAAGGSGGTTFALAFAHHFAKEGRRTLLIDMDVYAAPVSFMFNASNGAQETSGFLDMLSNPDRVDALFLERAIQKADDNLFYLSSRRRSADSDFKSEALATIVARAQQNFDMIVVDTPWRALPEPDWVRVNGPSYIIASPSPQSLLGFSTIAKELQGSATKSSVTGVINKTNEFKSNDISAKVFSEGFIGKVLPFPYDPGETGRLFFEQKTIDEMRGKAKKPIKSILATLPARAQTKGDISEVGSVSSNLPKKGASKAKNSGSFMDKIFKK